MGSTPTGPSNFNQSGTNDRRLAQRRNVVDAHLVTVDLAFQNGALLLDLSESGLGVQALSSAEIGATTSLNFDLPEAGGRVEAMGRVAWTDSSGRIGICFEDLAELSRTHLEQWLSRDRKPIATAATMGLPSWPPPHVRDEIAALRRDLITSKLEGDEALALLVERVCNVTRASGAAVAMEDGANIVCRASSGNAPPSGARVDPSSGLSGECVRTGEIVRCEDTETDPRADRLICRKLDLRSMVIVPIRIHGRTAGVLEAFSPRPHAFQSSDVLLLRRMSDLAAGIAVRQPETAAAIPGPPGFMAATSVDLVEESKRIGSAADEHTSMMEDILAQPTSPPPPEPAPIVETRFVTFEPPIADVPAPANDTSAVVRQREDSSDMGPVKAGNLHVTREAQSVRVNLTEAPAAPAVEIRIPEERPSRAPVMPSVVGATAAAAATAPIRRRPVPLQVEEEPESDMANDLAYEVALQKPSPWRLRLTGAAILLGVLLIGGWEIWRGVSPPKGTPMDSETKQNLSQPPAPTPTAVITPAAAVTTTSAAGAVTTSIEPVSMPLKPAASRTAPIAKSNVAPPQPSITAAANPGTTLPRSMGTAPATAKNEPIEAPPLGVIAGRQPGSNSMPNLMATAVPAPTLERPMISRMTGGKLIKRVEPTYPASGTGLRGEVVLKATIDKEGKVAKVNVVSGSALLAQAAVIAVKRWRYEPAYLNGIPIEMENTIVVNFKGAR